MNKITNVIANLTGDISKTIAIRKIEGAKTEQELRIIASHAGVIIATVKSRDLIEEAMRLSAAYVLDAFVMHFPDSAKMIDYIRSYDDAPAQTPRSSSQEGA